MEKNIDDSLFTLISRGGVYYQIPGDNSREALTNLIDMLKLPSSLDEAVDRAELLKAVLEREALMTTAVGHGIALPHPRNPLVTETGLQFVAIAFPKTPVDWHALDGEPVRTLILIVSASAKQHLHTLSRINYFCQHGDFRALLESRAPKEAITQAVTEIEQTWN
jgi:PTS system nitrogen regulatory IIA component